MARVKYRLGNEELDFVDGDFTLARENSYLVRKVRKWYDVDPNRTIYINVYVINHAVRPGLETNICIPIDDGVEVDIQCDADGNYTFLSSTGLRRVAIFAGDMSILYRHYEVPTIPGDAVILTITNPYPAKAPIPKSISSCGTGGVVKFDGPLANVVPALSSFIAIGKKNDVHAFKI